ncbi:MAG: hypothetical protein AB7G75_05835 [Candidatus Binatia bacterium]
MPIVSVVADANVLLSAVVGKALLRVFTKFTVTVHVARVTSKAKEKTRKNESDCVFQPVLPNLRL